MLNAKKCLSDELRFPFSLVHEAKHSAGQHERRVGEVTSLMDKAIGRPVLRIKGALSPNHYVEYDGLHLTGCYVYVMIRLLPPYMATFHLEIITSSNNPMRLTVSTLYSGESPRLFGSLRLPLPVMPDVWQVLVLDLNSILLKYCTPRGSAPVSLGAIKRVQMCSNILFRDFVTAARLYRPHDCPPFFSVKKLGSEKIAVEWSCVGESIQSVDYTTPTYARQITNDISMSQCREQSSLLVKSERRPLSAPGVSFPRSPMRSSEEVTAKLLAGVETEASCASISEKNKETIAAVCEELLFAHSPDCHTTATIPTIPRLFKPVIPIPSLSERAFLVEKLLGYRGGPALLLYSGGMVVYTSGNTLVLIDVAGCAAAESQASQPGLWSHFKGMIRESTIEHSRSGEYTQAFIRQHDAPITVLEVSYAKHGAGGLLATADGSPNGLICIYSLIDGKTVGSLRSHAGGCTTLAFSADGTMMVTVGYDAQHRTQLAVWDLQMLLIEPFRTRNSNLQTQMIDFMPGSSSAGMLLAKQLSDFHTQKVAFSPYKDFALVSCGRENIRFWRIKKGHLPGRPCILNHFGRGCTFTDLSFYSESSSFLSSPRDCAFLSTTLGTVVKVDLVKEQIICAYRLHTGSIHTFAIHSGYAISGGADMKIRLWPLDFSDFLLEATHESAVTNVAVSKDGRKVTIGTASGTLGVLDVSEHLYTTVLRSHVGKVACLTARRHGPSRSWLQGNIDSPNVGEIASTGSDGTIRVWDANSGTQKFEFTCADDEPRCVGYHPFQNIIAVGFSSGFLRIFDVSSASTVTPPRKIVDQPIVELCYAQIDVVKKDESLKPKLLLVALIADGHVAIFDANEAEIIVEMASFETGDVSSVSSYALVKLLQPCKPYLATSAITMALCPTNSLLAVSMGPLNSLAILNLVDFSLVLTPQTLVAQPFVFGPQRCNGGVANALGKDTKYSGTIVGLCFFKSAVKSRSQLLLCTSSYMLSLTVDDITISTQFTWDQFLVKRVPYGDMHFISSDQSNCEGLVLIGVTIPTSVGADDNKKICDGFVLVNVHVSRDHLVLVCPQLFRCPTGQGLSHVLPIFDSNFPFRGYVASFDTEGTLCLWSVVPGCMAERHRAVLTAYGKPNSTSQFILRC